MQAGVGAMANGRCCWAGVVGVRPALEDRWATFFNSYRRRSMPWPFEGLTSWAAHLIVASIGLILLLSFFVFLIQSRRKQGKPSKALLSVLAAASFLFLAAPPVSIWASTLIADEAVKIAGNEQYCIQVAERGGDYRPVTALVDLSPLTMHASRSSGVNLQYRALLIVGQGSRLQVYNWSYRSFTFDDGSGLWSGAPIGGPVIRCSPAARFAAALPMIGSGDGPTKYVRLNNYEFRIPSEYQPAPTSGHHPTIIISAVPPEFTPRLEAERYHDIRAMVEIQLVPIMPIEKYSRMEGKEIVEQSEEYGLRKVGYGSAGNTASVVYSLDSNGVMQTLIVCGVPKAEPVLCQQYFVHEGIQYTFFHASNVVKDWSEMQSRLIAMVQSWRSGT